MSIHHSKFNIWKPKRHLEDILVGTEQRNNLEESEKSKFIPIDSNPNRF